MGRRWAREKAFQLLYQLDVRPEGRNEQLEAFLAMLIARDDEDGDAFIRAGRGDGQSEDLRYIRELVDGVLHECPLLDELIQNNLKDWSLERLPKVDRTLLRLGAYEILYMPGVPKSVSINEIVLLAKLFAAEDARAYINGVLARFDKAEDDASAACTEAPAEASLPSPAAPEL